MDVQPSRSDIGAAGKNGSGSTEDGFDLLDSAPVPLALVTLEGDILRANTGFFRLADGRAANASGLAELVFPEDRDRLFAWLKDGISGETAEFRLAGGSFWVSASVSPADDETARLLALTDITQLKREVQDLAMRERRWHDALTNSGLGVWDQNYGAGVMYYSDTWRAIRGIGPDETLNEGMDDWILLVHPDDRAFVIDAIHRQNRGDPDFAVFQYRERYRGGGWVWIECRGAAVEWDDDGNPLRVVGTDTDITARKLAEELLAGMSRRLKLALSISKIGVFEVDLQSQTVHWDDGLLKMFGMEGTSNTKPESLWESLIHPDDRAATLRRVSMHIEHDGEFENDYRVLLGEGCVRHIRSRNVVFTDNAGRRYMLGANWDVTADVNLRHELLNAKTLAETRYRELEVTRARIEHNALHDYLTGLPNRRYMDEMLEMRAAECHVTGASIAVLHIDLDRFKQINDTLGHLAGDMMLQHAAAVLRANIREEDFVARIGGDEFVVLTRGDGSQRKLALFADRIIRELCKPVAFEGHMIRFGASIGIAVGGGADADAKQVLLNADIALYRAKNRGRNRHEFFSQDTQNQIIRHKQIADEILQALEQDQFVPYYQLQFNARTLDVAGVETLVRWRHPERGILTPDNFLAIADDLDVVSTIDAMVLEKALKALQIWESRGLLVPKVSVNVSTRRLNDPALMTKLKRLKIRPGTVSFELLETIFLDNCDSGVISNLERLRKLGIGIEIDDFGTGHASIVSLMRISPNTLKIDRQIINSVHRSAEQRKLVGAIVEMGRALNIQVAAEGVETTDHIRVLRETGCDILQGYGLARPMPFAEIEGFLRAESWRAGTNAVKDLQNRVRRAT